MKKTLADYEYYRTDLGVLYCGDCLEIMPLLVPVDLVLTDPPYGINWIPRINHQNQIWVDDKRFDPRPFLSIGEKHCFWGGNYFAHLLPPSQSWLTWVKRPIHSGTDFSKDSRTYATTELAWTNYGKNRFMCFVWDGGMRQGDPANRTFCHPSQKPIELMAWCMTDGGNSVLDPFIGSGTTAVACERLNRHWIGIEILEEYCAIAKKRIHTETRSLRNRFFRNPSQTKLQGLFK